MSQKTSVFNLEQLMDYLGSETFVGVTGAGYEPYKDQSGELRDTERFLLLDDKGFVWSLWVYETEEGFGAEAAYSQSDLAQYGLFFPEGETLEVQIYREPCWLLEAAELVYGLVNRIPAGKLTVPGQYCIPPDELRKIQEEACAGLDLEDELLRLYFRGTALEGVSGRKFCLGCALLYVSFDLAHPEPEEMTRCLKETWYKLRREQYRISGINMFSLGLERAKEPSFQTLAEEIGDLPVPVKLRMQILEVFSAYDVHLDRVVALLRPVAEALPALLRPWVERAAPLVKQWEEFFAAHTPQEFLYRRARVQVEDCQFLDMAPGPPLPSHLRPSAWRSGRKDGRPICPLVSFRTFAYSSERAETPPLVRCCMFVKNPLQINGAVDTRIPATNSHVFIKHQHHRSHKVVAEGQLFH